MPCWPNGREAGMTDDRSFERQFSEFWDALARGDKTARRAQLDRDSHDLVNHLKSHSSAQTPAGARERVLKAVTADIASRRNGKGHDVNHTATLAGPFASTRPGRAVPRPGGRGFSTHAGKSVRWTSHYAGMVAILSV